MDKFKKFFITTVVMFLSANFVCAENYILLSNYPIVSVECANTGVLSAKPLTSLMNERNTIIISPIKNGSTDLKIKLKNRTLSYKAIVNDGKIEFHGNKVIKIVPLDLPPEVQPQGVDCK